jgi:hypothetical protein
MQMLIEGDLGWLVRLVIGGRLRHLRHVIPYLLRFHAGVTRPELTPARWHWSVLPPHGDHETRANVLSFHSTMPTSIESQLGSAYRALNAFVATR